jgi:hypothetical protein
VTRSVNALKKLGKIPVKIARGVFVPGASEGAEIAILTLMPVNSG